MSKAKKRIFILGAGFSWHKTKILAKDYIGAIGKISNKISNRTGGYNPEAPAKRVMEFLKREKIPLSCDLELLFSNIEDTTSKQKKTDSFKSSLDELASIKNDIRSVLREIFFDMQRVQYTDEIIKFCQFLMKGDTVVTFNYDCLLENSIYWAKYRLKVKEGTPLFNPLDGYGIEFESDNICDEVRNVKSDIEILKLHGSVNWSKNNCGRNICLYEMTPDSPVKNGTKDAVGLVHHDSPDRSKLWMVEPSYNKNIDEFSILWQKAERHLSKADEIIIIGHSFPDADRGFRHSFKKAIKDNKKSPKFKIIDPNAEAIKENIKKLLELKDISVEICKNKFETWIKQSKGGVA